MKSLSSPTVKSFGGKIKMQMLSSTLGLDAVLGIYRWMPHLDICGWVVQSKQNKSTHSKKR